MAQEDHVNIVYPLDGDQNTPVVGVTKYSDTSILAMFVNNIVNPGDPYYVFATIPFDYSNGINVDWSGAPAAGTLGENKTNIDAMLANPPLSKISPPA